MLFYLFVFFISFQGLQAWEKPAGVVLDEVVAIVYQNDLPEFISREGLPEKTVVITKQDVLRHGFDGMSHTTSDLVEENLFAQRSEKFKMSLSQEDFERTLEKMNLGTPQLEALASDFNYADIVELKHDIHRIYSANLALGYETEAGLMLAEADIQAYYDANPVWLQPEYEIQVGSVFASPDAKPKTKKLLEKFIRTGKGFQVQWEEPITIQESQVSTENSFLKNLQEGEIYLRETATGFDLFKMICHRGHRLQPLSERKHQIIQTLRQEKYPSVLTQVKKDLLSNSNVCYPIQF